MAARGSKSNSPPTMSAVPAVIVGGNPGYLGAVVAGYNFSVWPTHTVSQSLDSRDWETTWLGWWAGGMTGG